ncbi:MAG: FAD-dependent oxidoreductase [Clostridia bacterium]
MYDIIIVGAGPSGLTAAIYALRSGKSVLIFEKEAYGGQISKSENVENYPSIKSISGMEFSQNLYNQAKDFGCEFAKKEVLQVIDGEIKIVKTKNAEYEAKAIIFALGAKPRQAGLKNEDKLIGRGLSYCAVCDGAFFRNRVVAIVGGGNTAVQDAIYMAGICEKVYIIHRRDEFRAEVGLVEKLKTLDNVELVLDSVLSNAVASPILKTISVKNVKTDEEKTLEVSGLFVAIGQVPQTKNFADILPLDDGGYVKTDETCKVKSGVYVCGDCRVKTIRQLTTAVSDGSIAGINALEFCNEH